MKKGDDSPPRRSASDLERARSKWLAEGRIVAVTRSRFDPRDGLIRSSDCVAAEEPLEIRIDGETLAITMRTPGDDADLALGFVFAEGIIGSRDDVGALRACTRPGDPDAGNVIDVVSGPGAKLDVERTQFARRGTLTTSACGVCGRQSVADLLTMWKPIDGRERVDPRLILAAPRRLGELQGVFDVTGGVHAALALDGAGRTLAFAEDVGRHNAVDKVVGALVRRGIVGESTAPSEQTARILVVSGRTSFEIVQKAFAARIDVICGVSAPTSLAVACAKEARIELCAFVRGESFAVYTESERLEAAASPRD